MRAPQSPNAPVPQHAASQQVARRHAHIPPQARSDGSTVEVLSNAPIQDVAADPSILKNMDGRVVGDATARNPEVPAEEIRQPKRYLVMKDYSGVINGQPGTRLNRGKVLDDANYDIRRLKHSGVSLKELKEGEDPIAYLEG